MHYGFQLRLTAAALIGMTTVSPTVVRAANEASCATTIETARLGVGANTLARVDALIKQIKEDRCVAPAAKCSQLSQDRTNYIAGNDMVRAGKIKEIQDAAGCS